MLSVRCCVSHPYSGSIKSHREVNNTLSKLSIKHIKRAQDVWLCSSAAVESVLFLFDLRFIFIVVRPWFFLVCIVHLFLGILTLFSLFWIQIGLVWLNCIPNTEWSFLLCGFFFVSCLASVHLQFYAERIPLWTVQIWI